MKTLLVRDPSGLPAIKPPVVAAIGNFDGLHLGHQAVLRQLLLERARLAGGEGRGTSVIISFRPHPAVVLGRAEKVPEIMTVRQKLDALAAFGVDCLYWLRFSRGLADQSAELFLETVLLQVLRVDCLVAGPDLTLGRDRLGTMDVIARFMRINGRSLKIVPFLTARGSKIGSRIIREMIARGEVSAVEQMLGRHYVMQGRVVRGDGRGRTLGFPTANLAPGRQIQPKLGVYAGWAKVESRLYAAVINIGQRPTFGGGLPSVEAYLVEYSGPDFYGSQVELGFVERIRSEIAFDGIAALRRQIQCDLKNARQVWAGLEPRGFK